MVGNSVGTYGLFWPQMASQPLDHRPLFHHRPRPCFLHQAFLPHKGPFALQLNFAHQRQTCTSVHLNLTQGPLRGLFHDPTLHLNPRQKSGFDLNEHWQADKDHYDNQKINGLTFPRTIRSSAFTRKLGIEGCDPLALPLAAFCINRPTTWLRKLAHGREMCLIPTGDIAAVVFTTELLSQLRNRGVDLDRVAMVRARQYGQTMDKISNTKHMAQVIAQEMQGWLPIWPTDPDSQHEKTQLRQQLAELRQRLGEEPAEGSTPPRTGQQSSSSQMSPLFPCQALPHRLLLQLTEDYLPRWFSTLSHTSEPSRIQLHLKTCHYRLPSDTDRMAQEPFIPEILSTSGQRLHQRLRAVCLQHLPESSTGFIIGTS